MKTSLALIALALSLATTTAQKMNVIRGDLGIIGKALTTANTPITISVTTLSNVHITLNPDGPLDASPMWGGNGPGSLFVSTDGMTATYVTSGTGTYTITITATSQGHPLGDTVVVTVTDPPKPPATSLRTAVQAVLKTP